MKNILIPTDFSNNSWSALEYATKLFKDIPCNFFIIHIGKLNQSGVQSNSFSLIPESQSTLVKEKLSGLSIQMKEIRTNQKHKFTILQEYGNLIDVIRRTIDDKNVDLIVMGTKGASGIKKVVVGSNTGDVITKIACNLLVIPEKANYSETKEIALPTDYTIFYSHSILEAISEILKISKANLNIINFSKFKDHTNLFQKQNKTYLKDYLEEIFEKSHSFHTITDKKVNTVIEEFSENGNMDMVIMVAKNLNFIQQLLFDSAVEKLSFHTKVPLFVLHE
tara:strand:- start:764 stop:1600 length:837 start_codon:yes stop_codon:yes gene_type:complete